ncbi:hypothetical protein L3Q82_018333 [Scortum barcoo]|uniref:Uncharacterized protein n=1 Tax=Scortum barcoo TaxID=214431 RepID=A0ACB8VJC3_9TELE|nr:hypothetical protein L3Q82_018333 [Scortum barcoo]
MGLNYILQQLFSRHTNDCTSGDPSVKLLKFTDDTMIISFIDEDHSNILESHLDSTSERGRVVRTEGVRLSDGNIADTEDNYKYLGIPQANGSLEEAARKLSTAKYLQRMRQVLRSQLNGKDKVPVINTYTLPVILLV